MLTIAGFDPSSGAGVTADLAVFAEHQCFGTACVTALTVQSTVGLRAVEAVRPELVRETLEHLWADVPADGIKIGMLATAEIVRAVADFIEQVRAAGGRVKVVLDPVLRSSSGTELLSAEGAEALQSRLLPLVDWVTPNLAELSALAGRGIHTPEEMERGAEALSALYPRLGVVATGGHLSGGADDLVWGPAGEREWMRGERLASRSTHGTGCAFSSAMACRLAAGADGLLAARDAKGFVCEAIRRAEPIGRGNGPMNLRWRMRV
jgi:hydroxymethylpyrimidine/phosphomethylpyrimidine kinase